MTAAATVLQEIHNILQVCGIFKHVAFTRFIYNEVFNSLEDFGVMDRDTDVLDIAKYLASRAVTTRVNLWTFQIKRLQALVWWIHDFQTQNQLIIADEFGHIKKVKIQTQR